MKLSQRADKTENAEVVFRTALRLFIFINCFKSDAVWSGCEFNA